MDKTIENDGIQGPKLSEEVEGLLLNIEDDEAREKLTNHYKTLEIQRMKHKVGADKANADFEEYKTLHPEKVEKTKVDSGNDSEWKDKIEFLVKHKEFDSDELDVVAIFAKGSEKSLDESLKNPAVEGALKAIREKKALERASMESGSRSDTGGEDTLLAKLRAGKLSEDEFRKNFRRVQQEFAQSKRGNRSFE